SRYDTERPASEGRPPRMDESLAPNEIGIPIDTLNSDYWRSQRDRLFIASCIALIVTAMSFAIRGDVIAQLGAQFHLSNQQLGWIAGTAAWGFTLSMIIGGPLCDVLGMGRMLVLAVIGHAIGIVMTIFATDFWTLF